MPAHPSGHRPHGAFAALFLILCLQVAQAGPKEYTSDVVFRTLELRKSLGQPNCEGGLLYDRLQDIVILGCKNSIAVLGFDQTRNWRVIKEVATTNSDGFGEVATDILQDGNNGYLFCGMLSCFYENATNVISGIISQTSRIILPKEYKLNKRIILKFDDNMFLAGSLYNGTAMMQRLFLEWHNSSYSTWLTSTITPPVAKKELMWFAPDTNFVKLITVENYVYVFFNEELAGLRCPAGGKIARVARICRDDFGVPWGNGFNIFQSFVKTKLPCYSPEMEYSNLNQVTYLKEVDEVHLLFREKNEKTEKGFGLCKMNIRNLDKLFDQNLMQFDDAGNSKGLWGPMSWEKRQLGCRTINESSSLWRPSELVVWSKMGSEWQNFEKDDANYTLRKKAWDNRIHNAFTMESNEMDTDIFPAYNGNVDQHLEGIFMDHVIDSTMKTRYIITAIFQNTVRRFIYINPGENKDASICIIQSYMTHSSSDYIDSALNAVIGWGELILLTSTGVDAMAVANCEIARNRPTCMEIGDIQCGWDTKAEKCIFMPREHQAMETWRRNEVPNCEKMLT